jgi:hypothetical protein
VDTIANLTGIAHPSVGTVDSKVAVVECFSTVGDGGGGVFFWDYAATTEDSGTLIRPTDVASTSAGRWRRMYSPPVNVRWFGATGNGTTDDSAAVQAAFDVAAAGARTVYMPPGTYFTGTTTLTTPTTSGGKLRVIGAGKGITRISRTAGSATNTLTISFTGAAVVEISDLTIDGPTGLGFDNNSKGVFWIGDAGHRLTIERVEITGTHDTALENSGGGRMELIDCDLQATDACVGMFSASTDPDGGGASFVARGGLWTTPNGDLSAGGSGGLYIHPHIPYTVSDITFMTMGRYGIYQNGSPTAPRGPAVATNCRFIDCEMAQTKGNGTSEFVGCVLLGTSSSLGSKLNGRVNISGCTFERGGIFSAGPAGASNVTVTGCVFVDTPILTCGDADSTWSFRDSTIIVTDAAGNWLGMSCVNGVTELDGVTFKDETVSSSYQTFVRMTLDAPVVRAKGCRFRDGRGTISSGFYVASGVLTAEDCEFTAGTNTKAISVAVGMPASSVDGENNRFLNGALVSVSSATQQRLVRRRGVNPNTVASALNLSASTTEFSHYDTHVVTGSTTIQNLTQTNGFVGSVRLVVAAGASWATGTSGNISPTTTAARTPGAVVQFLWEPIAAKWLEI